MQTLVTSIIKMHCPTCRTGNVFKNSNPYNIKTVGDIYNVCTVCGQNFRPEPGFYFGAAVVSYPITVLFNLFIALLFYLFVGSLFDHIVEVIVTMLIASLLMLPMVFRYSRIIWLHIIFRYRR
jgi:uncharacterized protein (DUF983 family)